MVLTWKQWLLSKATSWQPQVSALTGVVIEVLDGNALTVRLANADRNIDCAARKTYDDDGNRVYDKFELPGMDEESEEAAEEGYRTLDLADMIEPRIVQAAPGAREPSHPSQQEAAEDPDPGRWGCAVRRGRIRYPRRGDLGEECGRTRRVGCRHKVEDLRA